MSMTGLIKKMFKRIQKKSFLRTQLHASMRLMGSFAFLIKSSFISMAGFPVLRHSKSLGRVFIFMKRQSLQAQCPVGPATNDLLGSSRFKRCIMPVSVRIMKVSDGLSRQKETIFSVLQTSSAMSLTESMHSG